MQTLKASSSLRARPFTAARSVRVAPRLAIDQAARAQRVVLSRASVAEITDIESAGDEDQMDIFNSAAAGSEAEAMPTENVRLRIRMRGYDTSILHNACSQISSIANATGAAVKGPVMLPTKRRIYCVLRSPHVNKDAREHFEIKVHNRLVDLKNLSAQTVQAMMEWVPPAGLEVSCSVV